MYIVYVLQHIIIMQSFAQSFA